MCPARLKIIIAEDHSVQRRYLSQLVTKLGYVAIPASDGIEGLRLVQETGAQIVLCDLNMPGLSGIELTREIRKLRLEHYVHIIMVSGHWDEAKRTLALEAGVDDFISKGPERAMLYARIRAAERLIRHENELAMRNRVLKLAQDRIEEDMNAAAVAQRRLLPDLNAVNGDVHGFRMESLFVPSSFVSGDMFGLFPLCEHTLGFYTVDVAGHGIQASLLSVAIGHLVTPEYFREKAIQSNGAHDPAALVAALNSRFYDEGCDDYFTMFCSTIDTRTGLMTFCQAGHPSPFLLRRSGCAISIGDGGLPVSMLPDAQFENEVARFEPGAVLVLCSDAAIEAEDLDGEQFGTERLERTIEKMTGHGLSDIPKSISEALNSWRQGRELEDDLTVVALERIAQNDTHLGT